MLGLNELRQRLKGLPAKLQGPPARNALHAGAKVIKEAARHTSAWSDDSGFLRENIVQFSVRKSETQYDAEVRVGVRKRRAKKRSKALVKALVRRNRRQKRNFVTAYYWKYLEFGTSRMGARPFMRPAFEANKVDAAQRIADVLRTQIDKAAAKA
jgi:HK97 gp10 family phage protein